MGEGTATKVREIEAIRSRLDLELDELAQRLPPRETLVKRLIVAAVAGATAAFSLWFVAHRVHVRSQDHRLKRLVREAIEESRVTGR